MESPPRNISMYNCHPRFTLLTDRVKVTCNSFSCFHQTAKPRPDLTSISVSFFYLSSFSSIFSRCYNGLRIFMCVYCICMHKYINVHMCFMDGERANRQNVERKSIYEIQKKSYTIECAHFCWPTMREVTCYKIILLCITLYVYVKHFLNLFFPINCPLRQFLDQHPWR